MASRACQTLGLSSNVHLKEGVQPACDHTSDPPGPYASVKRLYSLYRLQSVRNL